MIAFLIVCLIPAALLFATLPMVLLGLMRESLSRASAGPEGQQAPVVGTPVSSPWAPPPSARFELQTAS